MSSPAAKARIHSKRKRRAIDALEEMYGAAAGAASPSPPAPAAGAAAGRAGGAAAAAAAAGGAAGEDAAPPAAAEAGRIDIYQPLQPKQVRTRHSPRLQAGP